MDKQKKDILNKEMCDKSEMIRFIQGPEQKVFADLAENLPGRGMWLKADKESLLLAINNGMFNKACHSDCSNMNEAFITEVRDLLKARVLSLLSLSKKSGDLIIGFDKVLDAVKSKKIAVFLVASDSGEDGKHKIEYKLDENTLVIDKFTGTELQEILGQDTVVVYGVISKSKLADKIITDYKKLLGFL